MTKRRGRNSKAEPDKPNKAEVWAAVIGAIGLIAAAIITYIVAPLILPLIKPPAVPTPTPTAQPALVIVAPADGSQVGAQVAVAGTLNADLCPGCAVYVVIRPELIEAPQTRWYGQDQAAVVEPGAGFALGAVNLGRNSTVDDCKWFNLWVVVSPTDLTGIRMSDEAWGAVPIMASASVRVQRTCPATP